MNSYRLFCLATTAGVGAFLYEPFLIKQRINSFKVNAHANCNCPPPEPQCPLTCPQTEKPDCGAKKSCQSGANATSPNFEGHRKWVANTNLISPQHGYPTVNSLYGEDYQICYNTMIGIPQWSLEHVNKSFLEKYPCHYCEAIQKGIIYSDKGLAFTLGGQLRLVKAINRHTNFELDPCMFFTYPPQVYRAVYQSNSLWDDFYHYVKFLTKKYKNVYICSGPLYTTCCKADSSFSCLTHFFKVILAENECGQYRFECYRFDNKPANCPHPELKHYRIARKDLEDQAGFLIFQNIRPFMITEIDIHPDFCPKWKSNNSCLPPSPKIKK